ncbi:hypothetical protein FBEOM_7472 [Fusarium beomiforme]|uniref:2EXR domain-containing protein n=1 Tax=Fusarium beomiforme TaxID=44412 RepID=A0A9P5AH15_9HYPO|nr:hypothetical protein FBEOM_7472 [Fusarium beomiforme]
MTSFHRFRDLPTELRQEIYFLTTPPRVVYLKTKHLNLSDFEELWKALPEKDKSSRHFLKWVEDKRLARQDSYLYSNAPIPVVLHTCFESRDFLINEMGYQLTFDKTSNGVRTWFSYDRDILLIPHRCGSYYARESAKLEPSDAAKVRRLALENTAIFLYELYQTKVRDGSVKWSNNGCVPCLNKRLMAFTRLQELLLVDWTRDHFPSALKMDAGYPEKPSPKRHGYDTRNLWKCVKVEESCLLRTLYNCGFRGCESRQGPKISEPLDKGTAHGLADWGTFDTRIARLESQLIRCQSTPFPPFGEWRVPRITPVHLIDERQEKILQENQKMAVEQLQALRRRWDQALQDRKARLEAGETCMTTGEHLYLTHNRWPEICWIEKDIFSR